MLVRCEPKGRGVLADLGCPVTGQCASSEVYLSEEYLAVVRKTQLLFPSIGSERKAYFPIRLRFFDPDVCSRSGWTVSSGDSVLRVRSEQQPIISEPLV